LYAALKSFLYALAAQRYVIAKERGRLSVITEMINHILKDLPITAITTLFETMI